MSKNSKNARRHAEARRITDMHKKGNKGPSRTKKQSSKRLTWHAKKDGKLGAAIVAALEARDAAKAAKAAE